MPFPFWCQATRGVAVEPRVCKALEWQLSQTLPPEKHQRAELMEMDQEMSASIQALV